jgi:glutamine---fructose-6-phosphate transaminase (isomerizing)
VISDRSETLAAATLGIRLPAGLPDWLMPLAAILPGQLLALHLALARGIDAEVPRWIRKVTLTN